MGIMLKIYQKYTTVARKRGWNRVATGHYARLDYDAGSGRWLLKKAAHLEKDQSYVLSVENLPKVYHICPPLATKTPGKTGIRDVKYMLYS